MIPLKKNWEPAEEMLNDQFVYKSKERVSEVVQLLDAQAPSHKAAYIPTVISKLKDENGYVRLNAAKILTALLKGQNPKVWEDFFDQIFSKFSEFSKAMEKPIRKLFSDISSEEGAQVLYKKLPDLISNSEMNNTNIAEYLMNHFCLISGKTSRKIIHAIKHDEPFQDIKCPANISLSELEKLRENYKEKKKEVEELDEEGLPSNQPFYLILKEKYPGYEWEDREKWPSLPGIEFSLASLLLFDLEDIIYLPYQRFCTGKSAIPKELVKDLFTLFRDIKAIFPNDNTIERIFDWVSKGVKGEQLCLFSPVCPDYSYEKNGTTWRYTFDELGDGVGLVALRILGILPTFLAFFQKYNIKVKIILGLADFEALVQSNLDRVKVDFDEFIKRVSRSRKAIQESTTIPLDVIMCSELCGGLEEWKKLAEKYRLDFEKGHFGNANINKETLIEIINKREVIYKRWYGEFDSFEEYLPYLFAQGAEYAAVGEIASKLENCFLLGADQPAMASFYDVNGAIPALYVKPNY